MRLDNIAVAVCALPRDAKTNSEIRDWVRDPYMTIMFININTGEEIINKHSYIYFNRAEYKKINYKTDLILGYDLWYLFNVMMYNNDLYFEAVEEVNYTLQEYLVVSNRINKQEKPDYRNLPYITDKNSIVTYIVWGE